jgi:streptomycin 6-kinase
MFEPYLSLWHLVPDGEPIVTHSSRLLPVRRGSEPAMLKIATGSEERAGASVMVWWNGNGAARVLAHEADAILLERLDGEGALAEMARSGRDDEASRILCGVAAHLHAPRNDPPPPVLVPLEHWFRQLAPAAERYGGVLRQSAAVAEELLAEPQDIVVLHGDLHHGNVLHAGPRGWVAIDPKHVTGERGYDFANIFCNPDREVATAPGRLERQLTVVAGSASLDRTRLLKWVLAYAGLSASWSLDDGDDAGPALAIAEQAAKLATSEGMATP